MSSRIFLGMPPPKIQEFIKKNQTPTLPFLDCLCFTCETETGSVAFTCYDVELNNWEGGFFTLDRSLQYSTNNQQSWSEWDGHIIDLTQGQKVYIRALNPNDEGFGNVGNARVSRNFKFEGQIAGSGNIQYMLTADGSRMDVPSWGYHSLFNDCSQLTKAPELPASIIADFSYFCMFFGCTSLTEAPNLPATTLADNCYDNMFCGCTSLTQAPELPATTLASSCYFYMFSNCDNMSKDIHMKSTINGTYSTGSHGTLIDGQNIIYDL